MRFMSLRLFAALDVPDEIAALLLPLQKGVTGAKWRPRENLHVTLRFFGDVVEPLADEIDAALDLIAGAHAPFDIRLKGAGAFGGADPHAIWMGVGESAPLNKLAEECERAARRAGLAPEPRKFQPHITMAYLAGADLSAVQNFVSRLSLFESAPFRMDRIGLYSSWNRKSAPNLYRLEAEYPLRGLISR